MRRSIIGLIVSMVMLFSTEAMALDLVQTNNPDVQNNFWVDNLIDLRFFDESHPGFSQMDSPGGWKVGIAAIRPEFAAQIQEIRIVGQKQTITVPDCYFFLGQDQCDYSYWIGHSVHAGDTFVVEGTDIDGNPINFYSDFYAIPVYFRFSVRGSSAITR